MKSPTEQCERNSDCTGAGQVCRQCLCAFASSPVEFDDEVDLPAAEMGAFDIKKCEGRFGCPLGSTCLTNNTCCVGGGGCGDFCCREGTICTRGSHNGVPRFDCCNPQDHQHEMLVPCDGVCCAGPENVTCFPARRITPLSTLTGEVRKIVQTTSTTRPRATTAFIPSSHTERAARGSVNPPDTLLAPICQLDRKPVRADSSPTATKRPLPATSRLTVNAEKNDWLGVHTLPER